MTRIFVYVPLIGAAFIAVGSVLTGKMDVATAAGLIAAALSGLHRPAKS